MLWVVVDDIIRGPLRRYIPKSLNFLKYFPQDFCSWCDGGQLKFIYPNENIYENRIRAEKCNLFIIL